MKGCHLTRTLTAAAVVVFAAGASLRVQASAASAPIGFGVPEPSGIIGDGFEEDLQLDTTSPGHEIIYSSAPVASTSGVSVIYRSVDGGQTFKEVPAEVSPTGKPTTCAGGGDAELNVDSAGHLYFADLQNLTNFSVDRSDDHGMTFNAPSCTGVPDAGVDRQWYTSIGDPTNGGALLLVYDRVDQDNPANCTGEEIGHNMLVIARSPVSPAEESEAGEVFTPSLPLSCDEGIMGNDVSYTYGDTGPRVFVVHDNRALDDISVDRCDVGSESLSDPTGLTNCVENVVASFPNDLTGANFPTITVDRQGGLFAVWEEAPDKGGSVDGNTQLYWSYSIDEGTTWSTPQQLPTPGSLQDVMAWGAAGDQGRVDVAYYGAPEPWAAGDTAGPDSINGHYGLYLVQTLDAVTCSPTCSVNPSPTWSAPVLASEHFSHYGSMYTLIGGQTGNRGVGDFFQLRIGPNGEAEISFADTNNFEGNLDLDPEAMYVRQISGPSVFAGVPAISGVPRSTNACENDTASDDGTLDSNGTVGPDQPNLDLLSACMSQPDPADYRVTMQVADLTSLAPPANPVTTTGGTTFIWQTQWHMPSRADTTNGGALMMVYMESEDGATPTCWIGQSSQQTIPGYELTYPGSIQLTGSDCSYSATAPGTITITFPVSDLSTIEPYPFDSTTLYSVTASTQTLPSGNAETPPATPPAPEVGSVQGQLPNLIDVLPAFDFSPQPSQSTPEAPWAPLLLLSGSATAVGAAVLWRRRARGAYTES
jgi:hypothetical protein